MSDRILIRWDDDLIQDGWIGVPNVLIRDHKLSMEARWLWIYMRSHSANFMARMETIQANAGCGRDKLRKIIKELCDAGYMSRGQERDDANRYGVPWYWLHNPRSSAPVTESPVTAPPLTESPSTALPATAPPSTENQSPALTSENLDLFPGDVFPVDGSPVDGEHNPLKKTIFKKTKNIKRSPSTTALCAAGFDEFWEAYPKKVSKGGARRKYELAVRRGADPLHILAAVKRYADAKNGTDRQFIKDPTTWLNQECWDDEVLPAPTPIHIPTQLPSWRRSSTFVTPNGRLMER